MTNNYQHNIIDDEEQQVFLEINQYLITIDRWDDFNYSRPSNIGNRVLVKALLTRNVTHNSHVGIQIRATNISYNEMIKKTVSNAQYVWMLSKSPESRDVLP